MVLISFIFISAYKMGAPYLIAAVAISGYFLYRKLFNKKKLQLPNIEENKWWGPGVAISPNDTSIRPFKIEFKDDMIQDLKARLAKTTLTTPLEGVGFEYGFNNKYLKEVIEFWSKDYNFKERESFFNQYPQFITNIQGLDIHFLHVKPTVTENVKVLPLLLLHGWPGSVREFYEIIPLLTTPRNGEDFVFELIIPSLPGYGFSQAAAKPGLGADQVAMVMRNLMRRLGYKRFYIQGGDWGAIIVHNLALFFPDEIIALHTNMVSSRTPLSMLKWILGSKYTRFVVPDQYKDRMYPVWDKIFFQLEEFGYMHLQATKPDTVGVALKDSPAGLAAYILEKFSTWTNPAFRKLEDGGITKKYTLTSVLDNVMIYWSSGSITTSMRLYAETFNKRYQGLQLAKHPVLVPSAVANFKHELGYTPEKALNSVFKSIIQVSHFEDGGHFAAFELPEVLADDVWSAISKFRRTNSTGYKKNQ